MAVYPDNLEQIPYSKSHIANLKSHRAAKRSAILPFTIRSFEVVLVRCALEPEHMEEHYVDSAYGKWIIGWQYGEDPGTDVLMGYISRDEIPIFPQSGLNSVFLLSGPNPQSRVFQRLPPGHWTLVTTAWACWITQPHWLTCDKCCLWDPIPQWCVTRLGTRMRRLFLDVVDMYDFSTLLLRPLFVIWINC